MDARHFADVAWSNIPYRNASLLHEATRFIGGISLGALGTII